MKRLVIFSFLWMFVLVLLGSVDAGEYTEGELVLDGLSDEVKIVDTFPDVGEQQTVCTWFNMTTFQSASPYIRGLYYLHDDSNDAVALRFNGFTCTYNDQLDFLISANAHCFSRRYNTNQLYHVCGTYNQSQRCVWVDGVLEECDDHTASVSPIDSIQIGRGEGGNRAVDGTMDEFLVFNKSLNSTDILDIYNLNRQDYNLSTANLVAYYDFDDGPSDFDDDSGNGLDGTAYGDVYTTSSINLQIDFESETTAAGNFSQDYIEANITVTSASGNLDTLTINLYNQTGLVNQTFDSSSSSSMNLFLNYTSLPEGEYYLNATANDTSGFVINLSTRTILLDTTNPKISFSTIGTEDNNTNFSRDWIYVNVSLTEINLANITYSLWNTSEVNSTTYTTNSSTTINWTGLADGTYTYNVTATDLAGNTNQTETRTIRLDTTSPTFASISHTYQGNNNSIDPSTNITVTLNVSDAFLGVSDVILQTYNGTAWLDNITMTNSTTNMSNSEWTANITTQSTNATYTFNVWANDSVGNSNVSSNTTFYSYWDCTWTATSTLNPGAGWDETKNVGYLIINNTGDEMYQNNNCSLTFDLTDDLSGDRIFIDGTNINLFGSYTVAAGAVQNVSINATYLSEVKQEDIILTTTDYYSYSDTSARNTTFTLVSNQQGPYLYQTITTNPSTTLYLTPQNLSFNGYVRNLMGSVIFNETNTAYNVTFNWSLPSGFTNSSGVLNINNSNVSNSSQIYNPINVTFSDLASMTEGLKTFYLYSQGVNLSGDLIRDANNNTLLTETFNITFLCYSVADGVTVAACGDQDGDYVAPSTSTGGGGGGGGGGAAGDLSEKSEATFELVRGEESTFYLPIENKLSSVKEDITIEVTGENSEYVSVLNKEIKELAPDSSKNITVRITSPAYFGRGTYILKFTIKGKIGNSTKNFQETKYVTLQIVELHRGEIERFLLTVEKQIDYMNESGFNILEVNELLREAREAYKVLDFLLADEKLSLIVSIKDAAFKSKILIGNLHQKIELAERGGVEVRETKKALYLAESTFNRGDYLEALTRLEKAVLIYGAEFSINPLYLIRNNPLETATTLLTFLLLAGGSYILSKRKYYQKRVRSLKKEQKLLLQLMQVAQKECFEEKRMSMGEYVETLAAYEHKLSKAIKDTISTEEKLSAMMKINGKKKALVSEKERIKKMIVDIQTSYLKEGKIETRVYENMLSTYMGRLGEIEETLLFDEAKSYAKKRGRKK